MIEQRKKDLPAEDFEKGQAPMDPMQILREQMGQNSVL